MPEFLSFIPMPEISSGTQAFIRIVYGLFLFGTLLNALPHWKYFFLSEKWKGYIQSGKWRDQILNPQIFPLVLIIWFLLSLSLIFNFYTVITSLANLILCRYFFVSLRWKSLLRGMGAPGFFTYWLAGAVFLFEYTANYATSLQPLSLLVLQYDFALIILSSGIYKYQAGYPKNHGMEYGLVNPEWGYWNKFYKKLKPENQIFKFLNHSAWSSQILSAVLLLIPETRYLGGLLIILSFAFILTQIRLGLLCEMVMLTGFLYFLPGSYPDKILNLLNISKLSVPDNNTFTLINSFLAFGLILYLFILPLAHAGLFYNFYGKKSLGKPLQKTLEIYTNFWGIIIWRVFSVDVINFYINVYKQKDSKNRILVSQYGKFSNHFNHVGESITITSIFTALKYYPANNSIFRERLLRYARAFDFNDGESFIFEYISIIKAENSFKFIPVREYVVNPTEGVIEENVLDSSIPVNQAHTVSPVHQGIRPGSYVPLKEK